MVDGEFQTKEIKANEMTEWLLDDNYLAFPSAGDRFENYVEETYFLKPIEKSAEFELAISQVCFAGRLQLSCFWRIKDTPENRSSLKAALAEHYNINVPSDEELKLYLADVRNRIKRDIIPRLVREHAETNMGREKTES